MKDESDTERLARWAGDFENMKRDGRWSEIVSLLVPVGRMCRCQTCWCCYVRKRYEEETRS